jgi:hypothetical protein
VFRSTGVIEVCVVMLTCEALLDLLQRLFDALSRAEALLANTEETDRAKLVDRLASEYTQLKYLVEKAQAENCKIVDSISPVSDPFDIRKRPRLYSSASRRSRVVSVGTCRHYWWTHYAMSRLNTFDNVSGHMT